MYVYIYKRLKQQTLDYIQSSVQPYAPVRHRHQA